MHSTVLNSGETIISKFRHRAALFITILLPRESAGEKRICRGANVSVLTRVAAIHFFHSTNMLLWTECLCASKLPVETPIPNMMVFRDRACVTRATTPPACYGEGKHMVIHKCPEITVICHSEAGE